MEIRTLRYFMAIAREENMTRAAETLHVTQPTLSKQMQALEAELGKKLFRRHSFSIELTEEGMLLRRRAEDLLSMADKIAAEFSAMDDIIGGNIYFGCAESFQIRYLARVIRHFKMQYPEFHYHITSGDTEQVTEKLDKGLLDFAVIVEQPDYEKYHVLQMPEGNRWGLIMPSGCALAQKDRIRPDDLRGLPLFCSEQGWRNDLPRWCADGMDVLRLEGSFRLAYNGAVFAREGLGYLLTFDHLVDTGPDSGLVFRPLDPPLESCMYIIWKKQQVFTPIAERFIDELKTAFQHP
nr:LysR family transcriptional regulator [uncultured Agathobaculum sp.]